MAIASKLLHFRQERAMELERVAKVLDQVLGGNISVSTSKVYDAAKLLRDKNYIQPMKNGNTDEECWGYSIHDFSVNIPMPRHVHPQDVKDLNVTFSIDLIAKCEDWEGMNDPLLELSFRVALKGVGKSSVHYSGFHIDKHDMSKKTDEAHPIYHIQYVCNPKNVADYQYGHFLSLDSPRVPHFPLDFILGIGFLTSNFFPTAFELLMDDGQFNKVSRLYQERIWKPYAHTLAHHWKPFESQAIVWAPTTHICPTIL